MKQKLVRSRKILIFAPMYPPAFLGGGPIRTLEALVREAPSQYELNVLTSDRDMGQPERLPVEKNRWTHGGSAQVYFASIDRAHRLARAFRAGRKLQPGLVYLNTFFDPVFGVIPRFIFSIPSKHRPQILIAPRGEFSEGALALKAPKKRLYIALYKLLRLERGVTWHASSDLEREDVRRVWGAECRVLVRENETSLPLEASVPTQSSEILRAVFLSRIVRKKGLLVAIEALRDVTVDVELTVFGAEEDIEYVSECRRAILHLPKNVSVNFMGPVEHSEVRAVFERFDVSLVPTAGENFGHVIAESLAASCPVMATRLTPWSETLSSGGGVIVESCNPSDWAHAITRYGNLTPEAKSERRFAAGRAYFEWRNQEKGPHVFDLFSMSTDEAPTRG